MLWLLAIVAVVGAIYFVGPRVPVDATISFDAASIGGDPVAYLAQRESAYDNIRDGLQKEIVWANPATRARTPLAIVYVHGFSASKGEVRPLPDIVAARLGANIFYTRLTGHGQDGLALASATVNHWINDLAEALAIGRMIGDEVVVMATSTGGGLAVWAASQPALMEKVRALVLVSPNLAIQNFGAALLTGPWGGQIANLVSGGERGFNPRNDKQAHFWTTRYPTAATLPVAAVARLARESAADKARVPALFVISDNDRVVNPLVTRTVAALWGAPHELVTVNDADDADNHVLAGDALSPSTTMRLADKTVDWLAALPR